MDKLKNVYESLKFENCMNSLKIVNLDLNELEKNVQQTVNLVSVKNSIIMQKITAINII